MKKQKIRWNRFFWIFLIGFFFLSFGGSYYQVMKYAKGPELFLDIANFVAILAAIFVLLLFVAEEPKM